MSENALSLAGSLDDVVKEKGMQQPPKVPVVLDVWEEIESDVEGRVVITQATHLPVSCIFALQRLPIDRWC